jgi:hypothetical protein
MIDNKNLSGSNQDISTEKLINALTKLDSVLSRCGVENYQERIHRIAKTIKSIEAHSDCYVSSFSLEDNEYIPFEKLYDQHMNYQSEYMSVNPNGKVEFLQGESSNKLTCEMADLLDFMEDELKIKQATNLDLKNDVEDSSSEDETQDKSSLSGGEAELRRIKQVKIDPQQEMKRKFFNIEIKLRAFIKQQQQNELLKGENFESFVNQIRLRTPQKTPIKPNPSFIKNFFQESIKDMENIKTKRMTLVNPNIKNMLGENFKEKNKDQMIKSEMIKAFPSSKDNAQKKVSDFNIDPISEDQLEFISGQTQTKNPKQSTDLTRGSVRNSIFRCPYMFDPNGEYLDDELLETPELKTKDDVQSVSSNSDDNSDSEGEYEEMEVEVEEEIEVEEVIKKKKTKPTPNPNA